MVGFKLIKSFSAAFALGIAALASSAVSAQTAPYTLISNVMEADTRVTAISIDFGKPLALNWKLDQAFSVNAELLPLKSYAGDVIANSAAAKAPRKILKAYTSAKPTPGSANQGRYVIIELDPDDFNATSWYVGFNPGIRQLLPYKENMFYEVRLLQDLNLVAPNIAPDRPSPIVEVVKAGTLLRQTGAQVATADHFTQAVFNLPENQQTKSIGYNFYKPNGLPEGAKVPLIVFLHGSGQSHDTKHFGNDVAADVKSPLLTNQGGVAWIERGRERAFVLVPQAPARDTSDARGENGWRSMDTQKLLLGLIDKIIADNPSIDPQRLYLTGLSMGARGAWGLLTHEDPAISRKFAAAVLFNGIPSASSAVASSLSGENASQRTARLASSIRSIDMRRVSVPVWMTHSDTDSVVPVIGSRLPFALLTGQALDEQNGELKVASSILKSSDRLVRRYEAKNTFNGADVRYSEYLFGNGDAFRDLGMFTRHSHFSWEISFKDQLIIDWLFAQRKR
jgi:predicted peptidase